MFWIRLANKKYDKSKCSTSSLFGNQMRKIYSLYCLVDSVDDYEKHFTVMNYSNYQTTQVHYQTFIQNIEKEHKLQWSKVQKEINVAIKGITSFAIDFKSHI